MSDSEDAFGLPGSDGGDDLFGDEPQPHVNELSDRDFESDKDVAASQNDVTQFDDDDDAAPAAQTKEESVLDVALSRHRLPKVRDGLLQSLRVPSFLSFNVYEYNPETFEPTEWDMENMASDKPKSVVRFQRDAKTGAPFSNTLIHRWSDGSLTIAVGGEHYEVQTKKMCTGLDMSYKERDDAHYYAAAPQFLKDSLLTVAHINEQHTVLLNRDMKDEATLKLARGMAAAARGRRPNEDDMIITATRDPELQKKEAEALEKERMRAQRKREHAAARVESRSTGYRGGLSRDDMDSGRRGGNSRKRDAGGASRAKRRRPEYDSDDDLPSGTRRQDEYDREDDFIAPSDDEMMSEAQDDDDEEDILDDEEDRRPRKKKQKVSEPEEDADADADADVDADADLDDLDAPVSMDQYRSRRRHIIDDDDE